MERLCELSNTWMTTFIFITAELNIITNYEGVNKSHLEMKSTSSTTLYTEYDGKCCEVFDKCFIILNSVAGGKKKKNTCEYFDSKNASKM